MTEARFVIEGHTDNLGAEDVNQKVGLARAWAVRQYLIEQCEIPAAVVRVVSYGSAQPVADNSTQDGRAKNRRVVITVVE
jgi:OOP family OmpA-OmpF porin